MLTQDINSVPGFNYDLRLYNSLSFPTLHIHRSAEIILPLEGSARVTVGNTDFTLEAGQALLALPFAPHAFIVDCAKLAVCVFSKDCARDFYDRLGNRRSIRPVFRPSTAAVKYLIDQLDFGRTIPAGTVSEADGVSELAVTSVLYAVLESFLTQVEFDSEPGIYEKLLDYISLHYAEELTLSSIAAVFGYEPHYLSRLIGRCTQMNLRSIINSCRIESAKDKLKSSMSITDAALSCGFGSLRSFDRVFREFVGMSPGEWLRQG